MKRQKASGRQKGGALERQLLAYSAAAAAALSGATPAAAQVDLSPEVDVELVFGGALECYAIDLDDNGVNDFEVFVTSTTTGTDTTLYAVVLGPVYGVGTCPSSTGSGSGSGAMGKRGRRAAGNWLWGKAVRKDGIPARPRVEERTRVNPGRAAGRRAGKAASSVSTSYKSFVTNGAFVKRLNAGDLIDEDQSWYNCSCVPLRVQTSSSGFGPWVAGSNAYVGLRLNFDTGDLNYGWLHLSIDADFETVTVHQWGYETTPNLGIEAGSSGSLPVELARFDATADETDVVLRWQTASETNNAGFEVQRKDAETWETLGFVAGGGTTADARDYVYRAAGLAPGAYQFRLKQIDYDGTFVYSPEVEATVDVPGAFVLAPAYPNPFNPQTRFHLWVADAQHVRVEVYDVLGRPVRTLHDGHLDGQHRHDFSLEAGDLSGGVYLIRATGEAFSATQRVTLVK